MSSDSFAVFRKSMGDDMAKMAQHHYRDLQPSDREALQTAAKKLSTYTLVSSAVGLSLGLYLAFRLRSSRTKMYQAIRASERPTHVQFADGRTESIPDMTPYLKPSTLGNIATYSLFGLGGVFIGGELGLLSGSMAAGRTITRDPESRQRIEIEFRKFRAEVLRAEADLLERGGGSLFGR